MNISIEFLVQPHGILSLVRWLKIEPITSCSIYRDAGYTHRHRNWLNLQPSDDTPLQYTLTHTNTLKYQSVRVVYSAPHILIEPKVQLAGVKSWTQPIAWGPRLWYLKGRKVSPIGGSIGNIYQSASATMIKLWPLPVKDNLEWNNTGT